MWRIVIMIETRQYKTVRVCSELQ